MNSTRPLLIFYEHPDWFRPLFNELDRRGTPYIRVHADGFAFDPAAQPPLASAVFNRMSPSAWKRGRGGACGDRTARNGPSPPLGGGIVRHYAPLTLPTLDAERGERGRLLRHRLDAVVAARRDRRARDHAAARAVGDRTPARVRLFFRARGECRCRGDGGRLNLHAISSHEHHFNTGDGSSCVGTGGT